MADEIQASEPVESTAPDDGVLPADDTNEFITGGEPAAADSPAESQSAEQPAVNAEATAVPAEAVTDWREQFRQQGIDLAGYDKPELALQHAFAAAQRSFAAQHQLQQRLSQAEHNAAKWAEYERQQAADKAKSEQEQSRPKRQVPEWNPEFESFLERDANGNIVAKPGADPSLPQKYLAYQRWRQAEQDKFIADPAEYMATTVFPAWQEQMQSMVDEKLNQVLGERDSKAAAQQMISEINSWAFVQNPDGSQAIGPNGLPLATQAGQVYFQHVQSLSQAGVPQEVVHQYAKLATLAELQAAGVPPQAVAQPAAAPAQAQRTKQQQQTAHLREVNQPVHQRGNRAGVVNRVDRPTGAAAIEADLLRRVQASGLKADDAMLRN